MGKWDQLAERSIVEKTMSALKANGITAYFVASGEEAKKKLYEIIPENAEIMNNSSTTLDIIGVSSEINKLAKYVSVRNKLNAMDRKTQGREMQKMGAAPEWAIGSVHAVTQDGAVMIASASGSQLPGYAFGSDHAVWVVGAQKIVKNLDDGFKRIYEHCLLLENERAKKVYGVGSAVNKVLIINNESQPGRMNLILVNEVLGF